MTTTAFLFAEQTPTQETKRRKIFAFPKQRQTGAYEARGPRSGRAQGCRKNGVPLSYLFSVSLLLCPSRADRPSSDPLEDTAVGSPRTGRNAMLERRPAAARPRVHSNRQIALALFAGHVTDVKGATGDGQGRSLNRRSCFRRCHGVAFERCVLNHRARPTHVRDHSLSAARRPARIGRTMSLTLSPRGRATQAISSVSP
jgi:hypothetical protein